MREKWKVKILKLLIGAKEPSKSLARVCRKTSNYNLQSASFSRVCTSSEPLKTLAMLCNVIISRKLELEFAVGGSFFKRPAFGSLHGNARYSSSFFSQVVNEQMDDGNI